MGNQPSQNALNNSLKDAVSGSSEIRISVTGRKSGRIISIPIWFVAEGDKLYLLPVQGANTQWYQNVLRNPTMRIAAGKAEEELRARPISDTKEISSVVEKFRAKYGTGDVKKYYSQFDIAVVVHLS
jgi:deazaflavin-dependent oxidoreductase (nitroreductase family)